MDGASTSAAAWLAMTAPALADASSQIDFGQGGNADPKSYWTVLVLFLISVPGEHCLAWPHRASTAHTHDACALHCLHFRSVGAASRRGRLVAQGYLAGCGRLSSPPTPPVLNQSHCGR